MTGPWEVVVGTTTTSVVLGTAIEEVLGIAIEEVLGTTVEEELAKTSEEERVGKASLVVMAEEVAGTAVEGGAGGV